MPVIGASLKRDIGEVALELGGPGLAPLTWPLPAGTNGSLGATAKFSKRSRTLTIVLQLAAKP